MSLLKKLASDTALYGLSSILGRVFNYLLVPLYTSRLYGFETAEFGVFTKLYAYVAFLNIIYTYGMETTFFRYAKKDNFINVYRLIISNLIITSALLSGLIILFAQPIAWSLGIENYANFVVWLALILAIDAIVSIPFARLRFENKAKKFAFLKLLNIFLTIFLNIFFLVICKEIHQGHWLGFLKPLIDSFYNPDFGVGYVILANLFANATYFVFLWPYFRDFRFRFHWPELQPMLKYAYPLIFLGLAGMINNMIDKILLEYWLPVGFYPGKSSLDAVGIYGACFKLSVFMTLAVQAFKYAAEPFFFAQSENKQAPELFAKVMHYFIIVCVVIWLGVCLYIDLIKTFFIPNPVYHEGLGVVPILLLGNLFLGIYYNLTVWFKLTDRTYYGTWISIFGACITVLGNYILIPQIGYMGCAWAALGAYWSMAALCYYYGNQYYPIPYRLKAAFVHIGLGGILLIINYLLAIDNLIIGFLLHTLLLSMYLGYVFITERKNLRVLQRIRAK
jgi:O-antigen/teichoic acid export membrane protein